MAEDLREPHAHCNLCGGDNDKRVLRSDRGRLGTWVGESITIQRRGLQISEGGHFCT